MRSRILFRAISAGFVFVSSLALAALPHQLRSSDEPPCATYRGKASWYGPGFHNNRTASGKIFDENGFTAASRTLPLNSWVTVTYNGRSVPVEITDRGPYIKGRIIDLSKRVATELGMKEVGVALVTINTCFFLPENDINAFRAPKGIDES